MTLLSDKGSGNFAPSVLKLLDEEEHGHGVAAMPAPATPVHSGAVLSDHSRYVASKSCSAAQEGAMSDHERRQQREAQSTAALRAGLSPQQLAALPTLEQFQWQLRFVRRPMFQQPVPVLLAPDGRRFVVLEADGSLNENPGFEIRP